VAQSVGFIVFFIINQIGSILSQTNYWLIWRIFPPLTFAAGNKHSIPLTECVAVNAVTSVLYFFLYCYFDSVLPHKIGTRLPWSFPLKFFHQSNNYFSPDNNMAGGDHSTVVNIVRLTKSYSDFLALDNVSMQLTSNEITVLLGKNGAGKTTLIHLITGLVEPTGGYVSSSSKTAIGLCPQHDIVWGDLTVDDHFMIFGILCGMSKNEIIQQRDHLISILGIPADHQTSPVKNLSGGTKRKLAVGLAFLHKDPSTSKIVILDEPTSGLDPFSRRQLWDAILQLKDNRIVLL
jgi:ABC-type Na+ transport system ATPase subunit NatA